MIGYVKLKATKKKRVASGQYWKDLGAVFAPNLGLILQQSK